MWKPRGALVLTSLLPGDGPVVTVALLTKFQPRVFNSLTNCCGEPSEPEVAHLRRPIKLELSFLVASGGTRCSEVLHYWNGDRREGSRVVNASLAMRSVFCDVFSAIRQSERSRHVHEAMLDGPRMKPTGSNIVWSWLAADVKLRPQCSWRSSMASLFQPFHGLAFSPPNCFCFSSSRRQMARWLGFWIQNKM